MEKGSKEAIILIRLLTGNKASDGKRDRLMLFFMYLVTLDLMRMEPGYLSQNNRWIPFRNGWKLFQELVLQNYFYIKKTV